MDTSIAMTTLETLKLEERPTRHVRLLIILIPVVVLPSRPVGRKPCLSLHKITPSYSQWVSRTWRLVLWSILRKY